MADEKNVTEHDDVQDVSQYPKYWLPSGVYSVLKWVALVLLPLVATAYPLVANVWGLGYGEQVSQTCSILALCVGVLIGASQLKASAS
jgi:hypothetical protein